ncbi:hypothetical protein Ddc_17217 [Ditylenchus destructor]|nr:hypothetical protein Ddc_17217 [Ditylenchus destructor]
MQVLITILPLVLLFSAFAAIAIAEEGMQTGENCQTDCTNEADGKTKKCTTHCVGKMQPTQTRKTGLLDKACVEECNGGPVTNLDELKPGCEEKCPFKGGLQSVTKKTEFPSLDACLSYCQEKGLGHSVEECKGKCKSGPVQMQQG